MTEAEIAVLKYLFFAGIDRDGEQSITRPKHQIVNDVVGPKFTSEQIAAATAFLVKGRYVSRRQKHSTSNFEYKITSKGVTEVAKMLLQANLRPSFEAVNSSNWTGIPPETVITRENQFALIHLLDDVKNELSNLDLTNSQKDQAISYLVASKMLAESPDPPADLIWEMINRANQVCGIASLFVSLFALFSTVTH